jgi:hypothetical protein
VAASGNHIASHRTASFVNSVADISYHSCWTHIWIWV